MSQSTVQNRLVPGWQRAVASLRRVAFWSSVLLPLVYLPLLSTRVRADVVGGSGVEAILGLVVLNILCLLVGHRYHP